MSAIQEWDVQAAVGNTEGVFDADYDFGDGVGGEGGMVGTAEEIAQELVRHLKGMDIRDFETMKYGTDDVYIQLILRPVTPGKAP